MGSTQEIVLTILQHHIVDLKKLGKQLADVMGPEYIYVSTTSDQERGAFRFTRSGGSEDAAECDASILEGITFESTTPLAPREMGKAGEVSFKVSNKLMVNGRAGIDGFETRASFTMTREKINFTNIRFMGPRNQVYTPQHSYVLVGNDSADCRPTRPDSQALVTDQMNESETQNRSKQTEWLAGAGVNIPRGARLQLRYRNQEEEEEGRTETNTKNRLEIYHDTTEDGMPKIIYARKFHRDENRASWEINKEKLPAVEFTPLVDSRPDVVRIRLFCLWSLTKEAQEPQAKGWVKRLIRTAEAWWSKGKNTANSAPSQLLFTNLAHAVELEVPGDFSLVVPERNATSTGTALNCTITPLPSSVGRNDET
ncbi:hypothetical protein H1R20_g6742, partial [Candolleomyces eurysporus]